jgi:hypothetical protein
MPVRHRPLVGNTPPAPVWAQVLAEQQPMLGDLTSRRKWQGWRRRVIGRYEAQGQACPLSALTAQLGVYPAIGTIVTDLYARWHAQLSIGVRALKQSGAIDPGTGVDRAQARHGHMSMFGAGFVPRQVSISSAIGA